MTHLLRGGVLCALALSVPLATLAQGPVRTPRVHALTHARIVVSPDRVIENGTVVIRDGIIEAVGASVEVPADAREVDLDSLTVYAGLIDLAFAVDPPPADDEEKDEPADLAHELAVVHPENDLGRELPWKEGDRDNRRSQGITTARVIPGSGVFRGEAAVVNLGSGALGENLLRPRAGQVLAFDTARGRSYPNSAMGSVAVMRQGLYDARWYRSAHTAYAKKPRGVERPEFNAAWEALVPGATGEERMIFVTGNVLDLLRAGGLGEEFDLRFEYVGSGEEYKRPEEVAAFAEGLVLPVAFPVEPSVGTPGATLNVSTETLRAWDDAPGNPAAMERVGVTFALTAHRLSDVGKFRENVGRAIERGLSAKTALAAVTTVPAAMIGMDGALGTVETGKIANLVVTDGDLFAKDTKVRSVWVDGNRYEVEEVKPPEGDPRGTWDLTALGAGGEKYPFTLVVGGEIGALTGTVSVMGNEIPADISQSGKRVIVSFNSAPLGSAGLIRFSLEFNEDAAAGSGGSPFGDFSLTGSRTAKPSREGGAR